MVAIPATSIVSLTSSGMPASGPVFGAAASAIAAGLTARTALMPGPAWLT